MKRKGVMVAVLAAVAIVITSAGALMLFSGGDGGGDSGAGRDGILGGGADSRAEESSFRGGACAVFTESDSTLHIVEDADAVATCYGSSDVGAVYNGLDGIEAGRGDGRPDRIDEGLGDESAVRDGEDGERSKGGIPPWVADGISSRIAAVSVEGGCLPRSLDHWFAGCTALSWVVWYPEADASRLESVRDMFRDCTGLRSAELRIGAVPMLRDASFMFFGCPALESVDLGGIDAPSVEDASSMFSGCSSLSGLQGEESLVRSSCRDVSHMFERCASLSLLDLDGWDVSGVERAGGMFSGCSGLKSALCVREWDMAALDDASNMFSGCASLDYVPVPRMPVVRSASGMFEGCAGLGIIKLTGMGTDRLEDVRAMFRGCSALESVWVAPSWDVSGVEHSEGMFEGCSRLRGEWGCSVNEEGVCDKTFARADKGPSQKGYFMEADGDGADV